MPGGVWQRGYHDIKACPMSLFWHFPAMVIEEKTGKVSAESVEGATRSCGQAEHHPNSPRDLNSQDLIGDQTP
ncbi:MAG: hypothetical protein JWM11_7801 [Planctomycetaceae bacterium]|nr:hypothetical protein [Planctomycetaceae bacterium]